MPKPRITKKPEVRRQEILDAAQALFAKHGFEGTAVSQIVALVGVQQGTFYHYFESKEALVEALILRSTEAMAERIAERIADRRLSLRARVAASLEEAFNPQDPFLLMFEHIHRARNSALNQKTHLLMSQRLTPILMELAREGNAAGVFSVRHLGITADFIIGGMSFLMDKEIYLGNAIDWQVLRPQMESLIEKLLGVREGWLDPIGGSNA
jgi:AcrR family transcriptional regulator